MPSDRDLSSRIDAHLAADAEAPRRERCEDLLREALNELEKWESLGGDLYHASHRDAKRIVELEAAKLKVEKSYNDMAWRILDLERRRDSEWNAAIEAAAQLADDGECLESCDSYAHADLCPVVNTSTAIRALKRPL